MAEQEPGGLDLPDQEAGAAFRAEMWLANTFLGYWKHLAAVIGVGLVCVLIYGIGMNQYRKAQKATTGRVADARSDLPGGASLGALTDADKASITEVADRLVAIGKESSGTASVEAYLEAAELYRIVDAPAARRAALQAAEPDSRAALRYAVVGALANLDLEEGQGDDAVARLRKLSTEVDGFLAEQALIDLGLALEHLERPSEASMVYDDFIKRFPDDSERLQTVQKRQAALQQGGT